MSEKEPAEPLKKVVGKKAPSDVWSELYRLNTFAANLGLLRAANDGYPPRKNCWKPSRASRASEADRGRTVSVAAFAWVAHASRVLALASRQRELSFSGASGKSTSPAGKDCFGATPKPARETRALPSILPSRAVITAGPDAGIFSRHLSPALDCSPNHGRRTQNSRATLADDGHRASPSFRRARPGHGDLEDLARRAI